MTEAPPGPASIDPSISVDVVSIDNQHRELVAAVDSLFADLKKGMGRDAMLAALDALTALVAAHFAHEERVMRNIGLPEYETHRQLHAALLDEIVQFAADAAAGLDREAVDNVERFLRYWLMRHISSEDMLIRRHINR